MLNLFKLPFQFSKRDEKTTPSMDMAIGIFQNFRRRNGSGQNDFDAMENEYKVTPGDMSQKDLHSIKEEFYEMMIKNLRNIEQDLDRNY